METVLSGAGMHELIVEIMCLYTPQDIQRQMAIMQFVARHTE